MMEERGPWKDCLGAETPEGVSVEAQESEGSENSEFGL
jgi:hypothetical protein